MISHPNHYSLTFFFGYKISMKIQRISHRLGSLLYFLHSFLVSYFRWEEVGGDKLMKFPRVEAPNGLHIRVSSY